MSSPAGVSESSAQSELDLWVRTGVFEALRIGLAHYFQAIDTHFSGLTVRLDDPLPQSRDIVFTLYRITDIGFAFEREVFISAGQIEPGAPLHLFWSPIPDSAGVRFLALASEAPRLGRPPYNLRSFVLEGGQSSLIHSNPRSPAIVPHGIGFSPVTQCNLNCVHCISRFSRKSVSILDESIWGEVSQHITAGRIASMSSDYSGDIMNSDRRHGGWLNKVIATGVSFNVDTHANDLTPEITDALLSSNLSSINFSVDCMFPDQYRTIRRGGKLPKVLDNIRHFMKMRNESRPDLQTIISFSLMKSTVSSLEPAVELAAELRVSWLQGNHLMVFTPDMTEESLMLDRPLYKRIFDEIHILGRMRGVEISFPEPVMARESRSGHAPCFVPWGAVQILGNGDVMACCIPGTKVGNLGEERLESIWNGPAMQAFRGRVNTDDPPEACSVCPMYRLPNNFASYVPGLASAERSVFEGRVARLQS